MPLEIDELDVIAARTPVIADLKPGGAYTAVDMYKAGGVGRADARAAGGAGCCTTCRRCRASTLAAEARGGARAGRASRSCCRWPSRKAPRGGFAILRGSLAPEGCVRQARRATIATRHVGPARVFDGEEAAFAAVQAGAIQTGDVVVIRGEGPVGGPGMREMLGVTAALVGRGLGDDVALVTDGRFSRRDLRLHGRPRRARGGDAAARSRFVRDGDVVRIDVEARRIDVEADLEPRKQGWSPPVVQAARRPRQVRGHGSIGVQGAVTTRR